MTVSLTDVRKVYSTRSGEHVVLDNINLTIQSGQKLAVLGRNGSGKSTLVRLLSGAELPTRGRVERQMSVSWPIAFDGAFQSSLTGVDNLKFICRVHGVDYRNKIDFIEDFSELGKFMKEPIKTYSSGMRARLAFAISMAIEFDCFLIDEVIAVGDSRFHLKCEEELFKKRGDRALVMVSHDSNAILKHCRTAIVILGGKLHTFNDVTEALAFHEQTLVPQ